LHLFQTGPNKHICFLKTTNYFCSNWFMQTFHFFLYLYEYLFSKIEKMRFFYTFNFIFKIFTYKQNFKFCGKNSSLVIFFLTTRYCYFFKILYILINCRFFEGAIFISFFKIVSCKHILDKQIQYIRNIHDICEFWIKSKKKVNDINARTWKLILLAIT